MVGGRAGRGVEELHYDILKEILIRVAGSSGGVKDFAKAIAVCKAFLLFAEDEDVLRAVAFDELSVDGRWEHFQVVRGLVCRCAKVGNEQAQFVLAKIILVSGSQLWKAKKEAATTAQCSPSCSFATQPKNSNIPEPSPTTLISDFLKTFLPNSTSPDFIPSHFNFLKIFLARATFSEFTDIITYIKDYVSYLIDCKEHKDQKQLHYYAKKHLDLYQSLWHREAFLVPVAVDSLGQATTMSLLLLGSKHKQQEISHNHHHHALAGSLATVLEDLGEELARLRDLKGVIERLKERPNRMALLSMLQMIELIERTNEEALGLLGCKEEIMSELEALLKH